MLTELQTTMEVAKDSTSPAGMYGDNQVAIALLRERGLLQPTVADLEMFTLPYKGTV